MSDTAHSGQPTGTSPAVEFLAFRLSEEPERMKPALEMGAVLNIEYLIGLDTVDDRMQRLVDIDRLMSSTDIGLMDKHVA